VSRVAALVLAGSIALAGCSLAPRPGDPNRLVKEDPRVLGCGIPIGEMWMAFPMARARDFTSHFPGWSEGAQELEVDDPALVIIGPGQPSGFPNEGSLYEMCIAIGPPIDAIVHHYGYTRFDGVRPDLGGPIVPMP
jgi:hypothetical protein